MFIFSHSSFFFFSFLGVGYFLIFLKVQNGAFLLAKNQFIFVFTLGGRVVPTGVLSFFHFPSVSSFFASTTTTTTTTTTKVDNTIELTTQYPDTINVLQIQKLSSNSITAAAPADAPLASISISALGDRGTGSSVNHYTNRRRMDSGASDRDDDDELLVQRIGRAYAKEMESADPAVDPGGIGGLLRKSFGAR